MGGVFQLTFGSVSITDNYSGQVFDLHNTTSNLYGNYC